MKPEVKLVGENGNIFNLAAIASKALKLEGLYEEAADMQERIFSCGSYDEALQVIMEYVDAC